MERDKVIEGVGDGVLDWEIVLEAEVEGARLRETEGDFEDEALSDDDLDPDLEGV